jgi:hypothetical protein
VENTRWNLRQKHSSRVFFNLSPVCLSFISTHSLSHQFHLLVLLIAYFLSPVSVTPVEGVTFSSFGWGRFEYGCHLRMRLKIECFISLKHSYVAKHRVLLQILCSWTLSIVLSLSKNAVLFIFQNTTFRRLDSFYLKTETEFSLRNVLKNKDKSFLDKDRAMDNALKQKYLYYYTIVTNFRSYLPFPILCTCKLLITVYRFSFYYYK